MNSRQRITAALRFERPDRVPVMPQVFAHAAALAGVPVDEYVRDGATLARCQLNALRHYGYDAVFSVMDVNVETEAVGSLLRYRPNRYPVVERYALSSGDRWDQLPIPDPRQAGRMPQMLQALRILRAELNDDVLVVGCVVGPFTLAAQMLGLETALYLAIDEPQRLERLMDFATEVIISFGRAQLQAGAHLPVVFDPCASPDVVPPTFFRELELPRLRRIFQALTEAGSSANWLHIAGPAAPILRYYPQAGVHLANFDYSVSPEEARQQLPSTCLDGNIKPLSFVEAGTAVVADQAAGLLRCLGDQGGFILSSGCEIPPESKPENVAALVDAARAHAFAAVM